MRNIIEYSINEKPMDFAAIFKASEVLLGIIQLDELLYQFTQIILQSSGADCCSLILQDCNGVWNVEAIATSETTELCSQSIEGNPNLPVKLIEYVKNTQEAVIIDNTNTDLPVIDEYLRQQKPYSLLCLPVINKGQLLGIVYLSNHSINPVFTSDRILILKFLCTQVAISLENLRLSQEASRSQISFQENESFVNARDDALTNRTSNDYGEEAECERQQLIQELSIFKFALDQSAMVAITDTSGAITYVNDSFCEVSGYSHDELIGNNLRILNSGYHSLAFFQDLWETITSGNIWRGQICNRNKNGNLYWIESTLIPFLDKQGQPFQYLAIRFDITGRKQAEQTISQQVERERLLREITQRIRQSLNLQTIFDTACKEIRQVIQADRVGIFKFYPKSTFDDGEFVAESVLEGFTSVMAVRVHDHCFGKNYAYLYCKGRFSAVNDIYNNGTTVCHTNILSKFEVRANLVMPLLCGEQLWGLLCIHQCGTTRKWQQSEIELTQQLANQLAIAIQQAKLFDRLQQELAERQQAQQLLTERNQQFAISNQELARATRLKDEFLANMSHELRTPLNAILGMAEGLQEKVFGQINDQQLKALQTIERSGSHLLELINDILDVSKIESGQMELDIIPTSVTPLCQSSLAFVKQQALKKHIQLQTNLPHKIPDLFIDERRIRQVLINLLNNAVKFTEKGSITLEVSLQEPFTEVNCTDNPSQKFLRIAVIDTGIGIAAGDIKRLFQPFVQIDSALNRQYTGTGLGLSLVKRIVELHGGQVGATSTVGVGSCFTVDLPCAVPASYSPQIKTQPELGSQPNDAVEETSDLILLAEDNEANINTVSSYLRAKGYRLLLAKNGQEAVALAKSETPELILMDIQMPGMDGIEAIEQIRRNPNLASVPIIALTALAMKGDRERCLAAGANDYLSKPVKLKQLASNIQELLVAREKT